MVDFARASEIIASQCALVRVRRASRALTRLYDEALRPSGLQATQLTMLVAVATCGDGGVKLGALADGLVMDRTTLTRNLAPLERAGLLRVARAPDDARVRLIFLTRQGERAIEAAFPLWERTQKHVRERLGPSEADALREELGRVVALAARPEKAPASERPARPAKAPARERPAKPAKRKAKRRSPEAR
ncbi:MarR family winged helix-turn-helix transcriptional regulator [Sorangium sp. So ce394]|uniref:MarR family winged helix-turn-helix transcriptional regulator n=1 Tax=Sorangium sp. So ce394 TaxID=3133310 RepID=UPI003F5BB959